MGSVAVHEMFTEHRRCGSRKRKNMHNDAAITVQYANKVEGRSEVKSLERGQSASVVYDTTGDESNSAK